MKVQNILRKLPVGLIIICIGLGFILRFQGAVFYVLVLITVVVTLFVLAKGRKKNE